MSGMKPCPGCGETPAPEAPSTYYVDDAPLDVDWERKRIGKWARVVCGCGWSAPEVHTGYGPLSEWSEDAITEWNRRVQAERDGVVGDE